MSRTIVYNDAYPLSDTFQDEIQNIWNNIHRMSDNNLRKAWRQRRRAVQRKPYGKHGVRR